MPDTYLNTGLSIKLIEQLKDIFSMFFSIQQVKLYGSRAKGTFRTGSDIDLVLTGDLSHQELMRIGVLIDDLFTPYTYDLTLLSEIKNASLIEHINRIGLVIYPEK